MAIEGRQLAQLQITNTGTNQLYKPAANIVARVTNVLVANVDASVSPLVQLYHDADGTTYATATTIMMLDSVPVKGTIEISDQNIHVDGRLGGSMGASIDDASGNILVTLYGEEDLRET